VAHFLYKTWTPSFDRKEITVKALDTAAAALLVVGGLNWGLVAVAEFDLVAALTGEDFGDTNPVSRVVYGLVGAAAVYAIVRLAGRRSALAQPAVAGR
jgi:hypothetical protein